MQRRIFSEVHDAYRDVVRRFLAEQVVPHQERWAEAGCVDREAWRAAGEVGLLCPWLDERWGGAGGDFLMSVVVMEELARVYESGFAMPLHSDIVVPYLHSFGTDEQKARWLPGCASGELVTAVAMTEPGTGSDLAAIATTARRDGDDYVVDGAKTFISNGLLADLVIVAVRTGSAHAPGDRHQQLSLVVVEAGTPGFHRGRKLKKMGMASQDTTELHFEGCRVPVANRLGAEGMGFLMLMQKLQQERLVVAVAAQASAEQVLEDCIRYVQERKAFGKPVAKFQNTQFQLAGAAAKVEVGRAFLDRLLQEHTAGEHLVKECSMAKLWQTEMLSEVVDTCLQFYGGYGYMLEYPISRAFMDARVQRIYAGTNEVMKLIIAKELGL
ncbi:MAG: acyl-CoA dehydrogenase family protein [Myxococcota bacterium]